VQEATGDYSSNRSEVSVGALVAEIVDDGIYNTATGLTYRAQEGHKPLPLVTLGQRSMGKGKGKVIPVL
jgi:hypothetical protein